MNFNMLMQKYPFLLNNNNFQAVISKFSSAKIIKNNNAISSMVYEVLDEKNIQYILKIPFNNAKLQREIFCLKYLQGSLPVADIVHVIEQIDDFPGAILMTKLPGLPINDEALIFELSLAMGEYLAKLHTVQVAQYQDFAKPNQIIKSPVAILEKYFQDSFAECKLVVDSTLLKKSEQIFTTLLPRASDFDGPNLVHRDYRPGNILTNNKHEIIGIIDFENAMAGFAQDDFSRMATLVWTKYPQLKKSFLHGYANIRKVPNLDFLPLLEMGKLLGAIGFTIVRKTWDNKHSHIYNNNLTMLRKLLKKI